MFKPWSQVAQHLGQVTVFAEVRRHQVVRFVDDQQVPGQLGALVSLRRSTVGDELLQHIRLSQVVIRGNDPGQCAPRVGIKPHLLLQAMGGGLVHDVEAQRELLFHFLLPLSAQGCWRDDQHPTDAALSHQFGQDQSSFNGLTETHVIGQQQGHARHAHGPGKGHQLEIIGTDSPVSRCGGHLITLTVGVFRGKKGRDSRPACGALQGQELVHAHRRIGIHPGERVGLQHHGLTLTLPQQSLFGVAIGVTELDGDKMKQL